MLEWCSAHSRAPFPRAFGGGSKMRPPVIARTSLCSRSASTTNLLAQFERFRILGQPMRCPQSCALALSAFLVGQIVPGAEPPADLVLLNGKILTVNPQSSIVEAAAVREGRFVAVRAIPK